ncbi:GerAB/ArcD/ProY family transporter [uncultured Metabacillus sp.]|uniref:GerAB/ArcD/ProY family transporter n=1 Tax=uncultured Metabacillus sp. TaxID=2860135 RepID=UPI002636A0AD|nr:GerAB/ArcD/ProY family transporter [uncultured Metabacillus sp.]
MDVTKISALQLFYVIVSFQIGNTLVYGLGGGAKQDAWLVIVLATLCGIIWMFVYTKLSSYYPNDTLLQMIPKIIGKFLSYPIILIYIVYFTYLASRACRDFAELIAATILVETPLIFVIGSFMVLMIYCLRGGVETFGRMGEAVFPIYTFSMFVIWILLFTVKPFTFNNLIPILGNGIQPILKEVFPTVLTFPFGEAVIIMMFFPFLNNKRYVKRVGMAVILTTGLLMTLDLIIVLSVLGPEIYSRDFFPLLTATRMVSIADFLERFDALVILMMVAGVFFKVGGWTFGAAIGIAHLFKLKQTKSVFLGLGLIITPWSVVNSPNQVTYNKFGLEFITLYAHIPLQIVFPMFLLCIAFVRKKVRTIRGGI